MGYRKVREKGDRPLFRLLAYYWYQNGPLFSITRLMTIENAPIDNQLTILLIDDEPGVLLALKLLMQTVGYAVIGFSDPRAAVEFLKGPEQCGVIICDLKMPKLDGIGVLQEAKRIRPNLPFILMSGHAQAPEIDRAKELGSVGFLGKPFSPTQLKEIIGNISLKGS